MANGLQQIVNPASFYGGSNIADAAFKKNDQTNQSLQFMAEQTRLRNQAEQQRQQSEVENAQRDQQLQQSQQTLDQSKQSNADSLDMELAKLLAQYGDEKSASAGINRLAEKHGWEPIEFKKKEKEATSDISLGEYRYYKTPQEAAEASKALGQEVLVNTPYELYLPKGEAKGTRRARVADIYDRGDYEREGKTFKGGQVVKPQFASIAKQYGIPEQVGGTEGKSMEQVLGEFAAKEDIRNKYLMARKDYGFDQSLELLKLRQEQNKKNSTLKAKMGKDYRNAESGLNSVYNALEIFNKNPNVTSLTGTFMQKFGVGSAGKFAAEMKNATDVITRIRTGAALNEQEMKFYNSVFTPKWWESKDNQKYKMELLGRVYEEAMHRIEDPTAPRTSLIQIGKNIKDSVGTTATKTTDSGKEQVTKQWVRVNGKLQEAK